MENREIKFRAFDDGAMIYSHNNIINCSTMQLNWFFGRIRTDAIFMQYTGLKDKNGKEIYEGDVLKGGRSKHGAVKFENGCFIVWDEPMGWDFDTFDEKPGIASTENWAVVIGNIYENPELLK